MYEELENKIKSMTAKEIILSMVDALKNPVTKIDMDTFGKIESNICYGCAATNQICKIGGLDPNEEIYKYSNNHYGRRYISSAFISAFEDAIDNLRIADIYNYNYFAIEYEFADIYIPDDFDRLEAIDNYNYKDEKVLQAYIDLANIQPE